MLNLFLMFLWLSFHELNNKKSYMKNEREIEIEKLNDGKVSVFLILFFVMKKIKKKAIIFKKQKKYTNKFHASDFATCVPEILLYDGF